MPHRIKPETRKPLFLQQESQILQLFEIISVKFVYGETSSGSQNYFSPAKFSYESKGLLFDQIKVSERRTDPEKFQKR